MRNAAASGDAPALAHLLKLDRSDRKNPESRLPDKYLWVIDAVDLSTTQHIMGCIDQLGRDRWWRDATPIGLACYYGHDACVSILLDCGASLVVGRLGLMTPIMCACLGALHTAQNAAEQPDVDVESSEIDLDLEFAIGKSDSRAKLEFVKPKSRIGLPHPNATVTSSTKGHERCVARLLDFERPSDVGAHFGFLDVCNVYDGKSAFHYAHVSDASPRHFIFCLSGLANLLLTAGCDDYELDPIPNIPIPRQLTKRLSVVEAASAADAVAGLVRGPLRSPTRRMIKAKSARGPPQVAKWTGVRIKSRTHRAPPMIKALSPARTPMVPITIGESTARSSFSVLLRPPDIYLGLQETVHSIRSTLLGCVDNERPVAQLLSLVKSPEIVADAIDDALEKQFPFLVSKEEDAKFPVMKVSAQVKTKLNHRVRVEVRVRPLKNGDTHSMGMRRVLVELSRAGLPRGYAPKIFAKLLEYSKNITGYNVDEGMNKRFADSAT